MQNRATTGLSILWQVSACDVLYGYGRTADSMQFTTIQNLHHLIRAVYGDSELTFTGELWTVPIQGVGQGNGAGPHVSQYSCPQYVTA
jgi:hypothetical protein